MTISINKRKPKVSKRKLTKKEILDLINKSKYTINEHEYNRLVKNPLENIGRKRMNSILAEELEYLEKKHPDLYDSSFFNKLDQELKIKEIKEYFEKLNNFFNNKNVGKFTIQKDGPFTKISKRKGKGKSNKSKRKGKGKSNKSKKKGKGEDESLDSLELSPLVNLEEEPSEKLTYPLTQEQKDYHSNYIADQMHEKFPLEDIKGINENAEKKKKEYFEKLNNDLDEGYNLLLEKEKEELLKQLKKLLKDVKTSKKNPKKRGTPNLGSRRKARKDPNKNVIDINTLHLEK